MSSLKSTVIFLSFLLLCAPLHATPQSGIHIRETLIHSDENTYIVMRESTLFPPSYYQLFRNVELIEYSNWSSEIRRSCMMARWSWSADDEGNEPLIPTKHEPDDQCNIADFIDNFGEARMNTLSLNVELIEMNIVDGQIKIKPHNRPERVLLPADYMTTHLGNKFIREQQEYEDSQGNIAGGFLGWEHQNAEICQIFGLMYQADWNYLQIQCGDDDSDGEMFFTQIPISASTWSRALQ